VGKSDRGDQADNPPHRWQADERLHGLPDAELRGTRGDSLRPSVGRRAERQPAAVIFYANNHLRAVSLDGASVFTIPGPYPAQLNPGMQLAIGPDGSVHTVLTTYSPGGSQLWFFPTPYPYNVFTQPDVGSDGIHYFVQNLGQLFALNTNGSERWHVTLADNVAGPVVDPLNTQLVLASAETLDHAGYILSRSATDGYELWRVTLPMEDGFNQFVDTRARFTADGMTAIITAIATGNNNTSKSFIYAVNASVTGSIPNAHTDADNNPNAYTDNRQQRQARRQHRDRRLPRK